MTPYRLAICVATRNRADYLAEMLESLAPQLTDEVEVVIVDGASNDATPDVVARFGDARANVRYMRLERNGGFDNDYDRAVVEASGAYCWLMTDDDTIRPGAVATILSALNAQPSLVVLNAEDWTVGLRQRLKSHRVPIQQDRRYAPGEDESLFVDLGFHLSFIGATVVDRELWLARRRAPYFGSAFVHFGVIFQAPLPRGALFLSEPALRGRIGNISYGPRRFDIWMFRWPRLVWSFAQFSRASREQVALEATWAHPQALFTARGNGVYDLGVFARRILPRRLAAGRLLVALIIACLPQSLPWLTMHLYWAFTARGDPTTRYDWLFSPAYDRWFSRWIRRPL